MANMEGIFGGIALAAVGALGISGLSAYKNRKTAQKLDIAMQDLERKGAEQISQDIINASVRRAAEEKAERISADIRESAKKNIRERVDAAVEEIVAGRKAEIVKAVDDKLTAESIQIDKDKLSRDVYASALNRITNDLYNDIRKKFTSMTDTSAPTASGNASDIITSICDDSTLSSYQKKDLIESLIAKM